MKYIVNLNGNRYEVEVEKGQANAVYTAPSPLQNIEPVLSAETAVAPFGMPVSLPTDADAITSPMPGTILAVKCKTGQPVKKGDLLFILEAMKMENEIFAPYDGTVSSVACSKGAAVETGSALCTLN